MTSAVALPLAGGCKGADQTAPSEAAGAPSSAGAVQSAAPSARAWTSSPDPKQRFSPEVLASATRRARIKGEDGLREMLHEGKCPNWVRGARSELREVKGGVVVTVTAKSEADIAEIRARAKYLAEGRSRQPDGTGLCPVHRDAAIEAADIDGGSRLTVRPSKRISLEQLRKAAKERLERLPID